MACERVTIDPATSPDRFLPVPPMGHVAVLKVGEEAQFKSAAFVRLPG